MTGAFKAWARWGMIALGFLCAAQCGRAQEMTLDQAQQLQKELETASAAVKDLQGEKAEAAKKSLERATAQLGDYLLALKKAKEAQERDVYSGGKKYPPIAGAALKAFEVPVNATEIHVPVVLDKPTVNTVIAHVRVADGTGGRADPDTTKPVIFYPGDPLTKTVTFKVKNMKEGNSVKVMQRDVPDGGVRKGDAILVTAKEGAVNEPITGGRTAATFSPLGALCYEATGQTIQYDDKGGPDTFSTALSHGRTQVGNGETGYYGPVDMNGFKRTEEGLVLSSRRMEKPMKVGSPAMEYPFLATMLSGHRTKNAMFKFGTVEWVVKMPNRPGSWPALWLVAAEGWPPEIDVYEGFGYNGSWKFPSSLSTNLHGGSSNQRTFTRPAMMMSMQDFGLKGTLDKEFHTFAVTVDPEWITMFIDGVETMQYANPFAGFTWYPLTNVAVKANVDSPYDAGSGDMTLKSLKIWRKE